MCLIKNHDHRNILVVIPARSGSKGIKDKNILQFHKGDSLLSRTVKQALRIFDKNQIFISTDSIDYLKYINKKFGLNLSQVRPIEISGDKSTSDEYLRHALNSQKKKLKIDWLLILQCTSPLRLDIDIVNLIKNRNLENDIYMSVFESNKSPYFNHRKLNNRGFLRPLIKNSNKRRQDFSNTFVLNGSMYLINIKSYYKSNYDLSSLKKSKPFIMPRSRSIDIDTKEDWDLALDYLKRNDEDS